MKTVGSVAAASKVTFGGKPTSIAWLHFTCDPKHPLACPKMFCPVETIHGFSMSLDLQSKPQQVEIWLVCSVSGAC